MRARLVIVVVLVSSMPSLAAAQELGRSLGSPITLPDPPPRRLLADDAAPRARPPGLWGSHGHAWAGFGLGVAAGMIGGTLIGVAATCDGSSAPECLPATLGWGLIGATAIAPLFAGLATYVVGESRGGTGNVFASIAGAYLGGGLGAGLGALVGIVDVGWGVVVGAVVGAFLTNFGAAIGYQLSSSGDETSDRAGLAPFFSPAPSGSGVVAGLIYTGA